MKHNSLRQNLLSTVTALGLLLTSCKASAPPGDHVTITFACHDYQRSLYEPLVRDFHKANPGIRVQFVSAEEASGQKREGNTVTVSTADFGRVATAADTFVWSAMLQPTDWAYVLNLQPFVDDDDSFPHEDFYPGTLDEFRWQRDLHGLPAEVQPMLIFYQEDMFDEAGVVYPEIGWTWDDFLETADRLTVRKEGGVSRYGFVIQSYYTSDIVLAMIKQYGVSLWDEGVDPPKPLFDRPKVAYALRRYTDLALTYEVMPVPELSSGMADALISEGKVAMWVDFAYHYNYHARRTNLGMVPFPEDVAAANPRSMYGFFVGAGTAHPEAAWRWLTYLSKHYQPVLDGILPARHSVGARVGWWGRLDEDAKAAVEYALAHPAPPDNSLNGPLTSAIFDVFEGRASVEEALATAQSRALALQSELAAATPVPPQPVATPQATSAGVKRMITFAPTAGADHSIYRALAATFHKSHPDVWVEVVSAPRTLLELAETSDCFAGAFPIQYAEMRQTIRSLDPFLGADASVDLNDFYPALLEQVQHSGQLWGLPYEADALMVYYNRKLFEEAGAKPPEPGWSIGDFLEVAVSLSSGSGQYGFTTREGAYGDLIFVLERLGARFTNQSQSPPEPTLDDPTVTAALTQYANFAWQGALSPATPASQSGWPDGTVWGVHPAGVESGQVAMWVDYIGNQAFAPPLPFMIGVAPLPSASGGEGVTEQASTEFSVRAYYVSAQAAYPQACWEWLVFLSSQPQVVRLLPARRSVAASQYWQSQINETDLLAYQATLEYKDTPVLRLRGESSVLVYTYPWLDEAFQAVLAGAEPAQALRQAQIQTEAFVACLEAGAGFTGHERLLACAGQVDKDYPLGE